MKTEPTKQTRSELNEDTGLLQVTTHEDLCSVELGATVKGEPQVKSVKVYAATAMEASLKALTTFKWLSAELAIILPEKGSETHD